MALPAAFVEKYTKLLGAEAPAFFASYNEAAGAGFRVNPLRPAVALNLDLTDPISYSKWGYRGQVNGNAIDTSAATSTVRNLAPRSLRRRRCQAKH